MKFNTKIWEKLIKDIKLLNEEKDTYKDLYLLIVEWLNMNIHYFYEQELNKIFKLEKYCKINPKNYPTEYMEESLHQTLKWIFSLNPNNYESIARILRDVLEKILLYKSNIICPQCKDDTLSILEDCNNTVILVCYNCDWTETLNNKEKYFKKFIFNPAKLKTLKKLGFIN